MTVFPVQKREIVILFLLFLSFFFFFNVHFENFRK
jgi:hypothetical protein